MVACLSVVRSVGRVRDRYGAASLLLVLRVHGPGRSIPLEPKGKFVATGGGGKRYEQFGGGSNSRVRPRVGSADFFSRVKHEFHQIPYCSSKSRSSKEFPIISLSPISRLLLSYYLGRLVRADADERYVLGFLRVSAFLLQPIPSLLFILLYPLTRERLFLLVIRTRF